MVTQSTIKIIHHSSFSECVTAFPCSLVLSCNSLQWSYLNKHNWFLPKFDITLREWVCFHICHYSTNKINILKLIWIGFGTNIMYLVLNNIWGSHADLKTLWYVCTQYSYWSTTIHNRMLFRGKTYKEKQRWEFCLDLNFWTFS